MKERPILLSGPMVRAILDGRKTQTRRVVKPAYVNDNGYRLHEVVHGDEARKLTGPNDRAYVGFGHPSSASPSYFGCPYGQPGDRLWVREAWQAIHVHVDPETGYGDDISVAWDITAHPGNYWRPVYAADPCHEKDRDDRGFPWRPSIHMPRWASRITLEITGVRVERLNDISEKDAKAEGVLKQRLDDLEPPTHWRGFAQLWESLNGAGSWAANPWVWVVEFRRLP